LIGLDWGREIGVCVNCVCGLVVCVGAEGAALLADPNRERVFWSRLKCRA